MIPGPQKAQKAQMPQIALDDAIDHVASRLSNVNEDPAFAQRIVARLPERRGWFGWLMQSWVPRFALLVLVAAGSLFLHRSTNTVAPIPASPVAATSLFMASVNPEPVSTKRLEPLEPVEPLEPLAKPDHERSLPAIEAVAALTVDSVAPAPLPDEAPLVIAPLAIADLALDPVQR